ncbi:ATP-binding protein, partial [Aetokthonos hydrillicola]|uniref:ATP-binding protein n=1 Tax=Aetokthonos hydrillicola TaxID=1550245 RepID=UPI001ABA35D8
NVIKFHTAIRHLEREKTLLALQLANSIQLVQRLEPKLNDKLEREQNNKTALLNRIEESDKRFQNKIQKVKDEISVLNDKLKSIKEKKEYYEQKKITDVVFRVSKKTDYEAEQTRLRKEKEVLSYQFKEVTQKFDLLEQAIENSYRDFKQHKTAQKLQLKEGFYIFKSEAKDQLDKLLQEIKLNSKQALDQAMAEAEQKQQAVHELKLKKEALKHKRFFEEEIAEATQQLSQLQLAIQQSTNEVSVQKSRQENTHRQWELEVNALQQNTERDITKLNETIDGYQQEIATIETRINNSKDSFYGWLNQHYAGWENTIGKVCDENVLFQNDLSPQRFADDAHSFYGVELKLKDIQKTVKTVADYENEKLQLLVRIELNKKKVQGYTDKQNEELEKLKRKYQPKLKEFKDSIAEHEYNIEQSHTKLDQAKLNKKDFELKAQSEKQAALQNIDAQIDAANETYLLAKQAQQGIEDNLQKQLKSKERDYDKKVATEEETLNAQLHILQQDIDQYETTYQQQKQQLAAQRNDELSGKGADTQKLTAIEKELAALQTELNFIEKHRDMVAEYNKDKRELLDKTDSFKNKKQLLEQQLENDEQKQQQHIQALKHEVKEIDQSIAAIRSDIQKAKEDIDAFADFQLTECYSSIAPAHKEAKDEYKTDKRTKTLVDELSRCYYNTIKRLDELKEAVNKFLSNFSAHNLFNFTTGLIARQQYLDFAEQLNEFVADNKIEEFEKRINERFATIIHSLGKETTNLMSKGD